MAKSFNISKLIGVGVSLATLDLSARLIPQLPGGIDEIASISIALARFPIMKKLTKGLPFGMSAIVNSLFTLSAAQIVMTRLPGLISSLSSGTGIGGFLGQNGTASKKVLA